MHFVYFKHFAMSFSAPRHGTTLFHALTLIRTEFSYLTLRLRDPPLKKKQLDSWKLAETTHKHCHHWNLDNCKIDARSLTPLTIGNLQEQRTSSSSTENWQITEPRRSTTLTQERMQSNLSFISLFFPSFNFLDEGPRPRSHGVEKRSF